MKIVPIKLQYFAYYICQYIVLYVRHDRVYNKKNCQTLKLSNY